MPTNWDIPDHMREDILRMHRRGVPVSEIVDIRCEYKYGNGCTATYI